MSRRFVAFGWPAAATANAATSSTAMNEWRFFPPPTSGTGCPEATALPMIIGNQTSMNTCGATMVQFMPLSRRWRSARALAANSGTGLASSTAAAEMNTNCLTPAWRAASMSAMFPSTSTEATVSSPPRCAEFALVITVVTPRHAASSEARSFRSPRTASAPARSVEPLRVRTRNGALCSSSLRAMTPPRSPVEPARRFIVAV
jgi:hypothetical protein